MKEYNQKEDNKKFLTGYLPTALLCFMGLIASVGCFNYASLAKEVGNPDDLFWFIGIGNAVVTIFYTIERVRQFIAEAKKNDFK